MILVTGGTGMVGAHLLLQLLHRNEAVRAIYRNPESIEKTKQLFHMENKMEWFAAIEWIQADITDIPALEKAFENIKYVYHCAALISFDPNDEEQLRKINIEGTANIVNCCIAFKVKKLCHVSSIAALGDAKEGEKIITETTEWNPEKNHSDYALTKFGAENEVWRGAQEGLEVIIVNPGVIFGKGFSASGSGVFFHKIQNGFSFFTLGTIAITAVEDVVKIMVELLQSENTGERYIIVSENIILQELLNNIADSMHKKRPSLYASPFLTSLFWRFDWFLSFLFFKKRSFVKATAIASHSKKIYDNSKVVHFLNFSFIPMKTYIATLAKRYLT